MRKLVIFTEELTLKVILEAMCKAFLPQAMAYKIIHFEGYDELQKQFPLYMVNEDATDFIITRDEDFWDCKTLKEQLLQKIPLNYKTNTLVRLICNELESWYLGDIDSLKLVGLINDAQIQSVNERIVDAIDKTQKPKKTIFEPILRRGSSERLAQQLAPTLIQHYQRNRSHSFQLMVKTLQSFAHA